MKQLHCGPFLLCNYVSNQWFPGSCSDFKVWHQEEKTLDMDVTAWVKGLHRGDSASYRRWDDSYHHPLSHLLPRVPGHPRKWAALSKHLLQSTTNTKWCQWWLILSPNEFKPSGSVPCTLAHSSLAKASGSLILLGFPLNLERSPRNYCATNLWSNWWNAWVIVMFKGLAMLESQFPHRGRQVQGWPDATFEWIHLARAATVLPCRQTDLYSACFILLPPDMLVIHRPG